MNGEGVAKINGKICLLSGGLMGESVQAKIITDHSNYSVGKIAKILTASKSRVNPPCPYFTECGGCALQHMNYEEQLNFKQMLVAKTLKKVARIETEVACCVASAHQFNQRNKASFNFNANGAGFYAKNSKFVVNIENCLLVNSAINQIYALFKQTVNTKSGKIKNLVVRFINNTALIGVVATEKIDLSTFSTSLINNGVDFGLYLIINTRKDSVVLSGKTIHLAGKKIINIENFGIKYAVDLLAFHQTNEDIQNKIYSKVLSHISANSVVLNGFSGAGLLSAIIATKAKQVFGIEIEKSAHLSAEKLKNDNKITNLTNFLGDFNQKLTNLLPKCDTIILDPAKKGCGKKVMQQINGVKNLIYISCNPIALAKDLREIIEDYTIEEITPFDMFPNTSSVETFVKLTKK